MRFASSPKGIFDLVAARLRCDHYPAAVLQTRFNLTALSVIWEIILRDFWGAILRAQVSGARRFASGC